MQAERLTIPDWSRDDYISTQAPYEWLYRFKDNKFLLTQLREQIRARAGACGVKNFIALWNSYLESVRGAAGARPDNVTQFSAQPWEMLCGNYVCDDFGITTTDRYGFEVQVLNHPLFPVMRLVNADTHEERLVLKYYKGGACCDLTVSKDVLASAPRIVELAKYGIAVNSENAKHLVKYLTTIEHLNYDLIPESRSVGRLGWINGSGFSPYDSSLTFDGDESFRHMFHSVRECGSRAAWLDAARAVRKGGVPARIMLAASFSSVLVEKCNALPFFVHLWGGTGTGKTVALMLAASVWASPALGDYITTFNSTRTGRELTAGFFNSLPLCLDELQIQSEHREDFDRDIYMLTEGVGRTRGSRQGGVQRVPTWHNCILSTGETPISSASSGGGAVNRVIEIDCGGENLFHDPAGLVVLLKQNYGHAGKEFVDRLSGADEAKLREVQTQYAGTLMKAGGTDKQSASASLILLADRLAGEWIFQDGAPLEPPDVLPYLKAREAVDQNARCYDWLMDRIHGNMHRFEESAPVEHWGAYDGEYVYFIKSFFDAELKNAGFNSDAFLSWAKRRGVISCSDGRTTKIKYLGGGRNARCVWLRWQSRFGNGGDLPF